MIDIVKQTPLELSKESRDYQIIARLYSALFNVSKMYIDNMQVWNNDIDNKLATLRSRTLNFQISRVWDLNDLEAITACFKYLMMNKGTTTALKIILSVLMKVENIDSTINGSTITFKDNCLTIKVEKDLVSIGVLEDLIKYILPAGIIYRIIKFVSYSDNSSKITDVYFISSDTDVTVNKKKIEGSVKQKLYISDNQVGVSKDDQHTIQTTFIYGSEEYE